VVQGSGSGFLDSSNGKTFQIGSYILISGLALQVTAFGFFTITAIRFDIRYKREFGLDGRERYIALLYCLYASCLCILVSFYFGFYFVSPSFLRVGLACGRLSSPQHPCTPSPHAGLRNRVGLGVCGCLPYFHMSRSLFLFLFLLDFIGACISVPLHP